MQNPPGTEQSTAPKAESGRLEKKLEAYKRYFHPADTEKLSAPRRTAIFLLPTVAHFIQSAFCGVILALIALSTQQLRDTKFLALALDFGDSFLHHYNTFPLALFYLTLIASLIAILGNEEVSFFFRKVLAEPLESFIFHTSSLSFGALAVSYWFGHFPVVGIPPWAAFAFIFFASSLLSIIVRAIPGMVNERRVVRVKLLGKIANAALTSISIFVLIAVTWMLSQMGS
jgi:hypothetical protein